MDTLRVLEHRERESKRASVFFYHRQRRKNFVYFTCYVKNYNRAMDEELLKKKLFFLLNTLSLFFSLKVVVASS